MIYIAGPFFTEEERKQLNYMISCARKAYTDEEIFIPMEHTIPNGENLPNHEWAKAVFEMDVEAINKCDQVIALYLGHYSDTGTAWEIGYAYAKGIPVKMFIPWKYEQTDMSIMPINSSEIIGGVVDSKLNQK